MCHVDIKPVGRQVGGNGWVGFDSEGVLTLLAPHGEGKRDNSHTHSDKFRERRHQDNGLLYAK